MKGKAALAVVVAAGLVGGVGLAEGRGSRGEGRGRGGAALADYLGLTAEQREQWKALRDEHRKESAPLRAEGRELHDKLRAAMDAQKADPEAVGKAMLAMKDHREKVKSSRDAFQARVKSQLTPEQVQKFEAFEAARAFGRGGRGGRPGRGMGGPGGHSPRGGGLRPGDGGFDASPGIIPDEDFLPPSIEG